MSTLAASELHTIIDLIRYGASRFNAAGLIFGHSHDNALDEATHLVLHSLHLPPDIGPAYGVARVLPEERQQILALFERRINERIPAAYLTGQAWFAGLNFKNDNRALVPRSPIAELIESGFEPWLGDLEVQRALDMCTGSGCIAIAMAHYFPEWQVDGIDICPHALQLAEENKQRHQLQNVHFSRSNLFADLGARRYELIVSNPPYVTHEEVAALPDEYSHEPELALRAGADGLDLALKILRDAPDYLTKEGILICEVGESARHLIELLPTMELAWVEFKVGQMGVFIVKCSELLAHRSRISELASTR